jgi:cytochrome c5
MIAAAALGIVGFGYFSLATRGQATDPQLVAGKRLYAANCAGCHGAELEGQPDWMKRLPNGRLPAPPHAASGHTGIIPTSSCSTSPSSGWRRLYRVTKPACRPSRAC